MNTIRDEWKVFEGEVVRIDLPPQQRRDCCVAFYAGALAVMRAQMRNNDLSNAAVVALFNSWDEECVQLLIAAGQGKPIL